MSLNVTRTDVWAASMKDRPGGLAAKLTALHGAGANLLAVDSAAAAAKAIRVLRALR